jgi:hypothetical protein
VPGAFRRSRLIWIAAATAAMLLLAVWLLRPESEPDPCDGLRAAPPSETRLMPAGLSFAGIGPVTRVSKGGPYVNIFAVTTKPLDEATILIQDAVTAAGYRPSGIDNEGFEAEVFFDTGSYAAGQARVRRSACQGRWDVDLVLLERRS